jgi:hypothetical protein
MLVDFAQLSSNKDQRPKTTKPVVVELHRTDVTFGIEHEPEKNSGDIKITTSGLYVLIAAPQIGRKSGTKPRYIDFWLRKNGKDILDSNIRITTINKYFKTVVVNQTMMPFRQDDVINLMMSVEVANEGLGIETFHPKGEPRIPSIIFSMHLVREWDQMISKEKPRKGVQ